MVLSAWGVLPGWVGPLTTLLAIPYAMATRRAFRRWEAFASGRCPVCGYDLRATPDRCPECGTMPTVTNEYAKPERGWPKAGK